MAVTNETYSRLISALGSAGSADEISNGVGGFPTVTTSATSRTLSKSDSGKYLRFTSGSSVSVNLPPQSDVRWDADVEIVIEQAGAGQVTIVAGSGVTIRTSSTLKTNAQYSAISLKRVALNEWVCGGDRSAS
jgi:hypothetical protein